MTDIPSTAQRLQWFIDAILMEERKFRLWSHQLQIDFSDLEQMHKDGVSRKGGCGGNADTRKTHQEIFTRHREMRDSHRNARAYCHELAERLESGHFQGSDLTRAVEKLSSFYESIRADHNLMVKERRRLIAEHLALLKAAQERPSAR